MQTVLLGSSNSAAVEFVIPEAGSYIMSLACNIAAALYFALGATVVWSAAGVMAVGALLGGWAGGRLAGRVQAGTLRLIVITVGLVVAAMFALGW